MNYTDLITQRTAVTTSWERLNNNRTREWDLYGYDTGLHPLNMAIGGIIPTRVTVIGARSGSGKAQPLYSRVYTPNGYTTIGELSVGDEVLTVDGSITKVTGVYPQGIRTVYRLTMSDGAVVHADENHLWKIYTAYDRKAVSDSKQYKTTSISADKHSILTTKQLVGKEFIFMSKGREKVRNLKLPVCQALQFNKKDLIIPPYALGALIGDGSFDRGGLSSTDKEILDRVATELGADLSQSEEGCDYRLINCKLKPRLRKLFGTTHLLAYDKFIPKDYLYSSIEDRVNLLRGLMDTDGSTTRAGTSQLFHTSSAKLAQDVVELVNGLGGIAHILNRGKKFYEYKGKKQSKHYAYDVVINLPGEINPFFLKRKANLVKAKSDYKTPRYIEKVEVIGQDRTVCISVEHESHLYITDGCVVTHNTAFTVPMFDATSRRKADGSRLEYLFFTWELDPSIVIDRSISSKVGVTLRQLNQGAKLLSEKAMTQIRSAYDVTVKYPITYQIHSTDINEVRGIAKEFVDRCREKSKVEGNYVHPVICIDYLNMAQFESAGLRTYGIGDFMNGLKQFCNIEKASAIVFAQLSRETDKQSKIPDRSDFSDSAAIENAADNLIVLYRPEYHKISTILNPDTNVEEDSRNKVLVRVLKGRDYGVGDFLIRCDIKYFRFWDYYHNFDTPYWLDYTNEDFWLKEFKLTPVIEQTEVPF